MQVMLERDHEKPLHGRVEMDDAYGEMSAAVASEGQVRRIKSIILDVRVSFL
jgi:hypothetical protein